MEGDHQGYVDEAKVRFRTPCHLVGSRTWGCEGWGLNRFNHCVLVTANVSGTGVLGPGNRNQRLEPARGLAPFAKAPRKAVRSGISSQKTDDGARGACLAGASALFGRALGKSGPSGVVSSADWWLGGSIGETCHGQHPRAPACRPWLHRAACSFAGRWERWRSGWTCADGRGGRRDPHATPK